MDFEYVVLPMSILLVGVVVIWLSIRRILSLSAKFSDKRWRRVAERIVLSAIVLVATIVAGCASFNAIARLWFRAHNPPPGEMYAVDGYKMHMYCTGVIAHDCSRCGPGRRRGHLGRCPARTRRNHARLVYDRAGFGWSQAGPAPRDADHIASELHGLLRQAKVDLPFVLMGHSIAGIYMRAYAAHYLEDLAGMVFVDGSTPMQQENPVVKAMMGKGPLLHG